MEAPTTTRRVAAAASARAISFPSARMLEAQRNFQSVVKQELQTLLEGGTKREEAVKLLLRRIVASTEPPEATAVRGVMRQFQMNYDDAVRALIVKQELGRLKRQGLDSFAAIEELTRKMSSRDEVEQEEEQEEEQEVEHKDSSVEEKNEQVSAREQEKEALPAAEMASPEKTETRRLCPLFNVLVKCPSPLATQPRGRAKNVKMRRKQMKIQTERMSLWGSATRRYSSLRCECEAPTATPWQTSHRSHANDVLPLASSTIPPATAVADVV
ncbi:hypothetical protein GN244_ATG14098 [Phytophthora infestans]|uniref:Uncharacterized protein n=1 Tax=Phytophthora infestans TaxID=4787 RepID=A0A833WGQ6_PHYIN|nr:hypothetical protein GN244_ATG14098 [Phytophthora infestans]